MVELGLAGAGLKLAPTAVATAVTDSDAPPNTCRRTLHTLPTDTERVAGDAMARSQHPQRRRCLGLRDPASQPGTWRVSSQSCAKLNCCGSLGIVEVQLLLKLSDEWSADRDKPCDTSQQRSTREHRISNQFGCLLYRMPKPRGIGENQRTPSTFEESSSLQCLEFSTHRLSPNADACREF
jgi:hypothetical protein